MRAILAAGAAAGLIVFAAQAEGEGDPAAPMPEPQAPVVQWETLADSLVGRSVVRPAVTAASAAPATAGEPLADIDVVDAHWMALTMWGEARGQGEEAMRAVGHVIDNRRRSGAHGVFATDTVSEAWQFSCWNPDDPNRAAMLRADAYPADSHDGAMWLAARRIAAEILAGRSHDPTGGALFYHSVDVAPLWSRGMMPVTRIGGHVFFRTARRA
jgi:spore germination cell wall hydrolase CwlJ-like protein